MAERIDPREIHHTPIPQPYIVDRRNPTGQPTMKECSKLDTFASINSTLMRLEDKIDDIQKQFNEKADKLADGMNKMIALEQQMLAQSNDIKDLERTIDELRNHKVQLEIRLNTLQTTFDSHRNNMGKYEKIIWGVGSLIGSLIGAYLLKQMGV